MWSQGNKVMLERIIKRGWRLISYENLDLCKSLHNFESMLCYLIGVKFYKIIKLDYHSYLLKKIKMQDTRHEQNTRFIVYNYNAKFFSKSMCHQSVPYQSIHE